MFDDFDTFIQSDEFAQEYEEYLQWCEEMERFHEPEEEEVI